jgi:hypothetical protein
VLPAEENRHRAQRRVARGRGRIADRTLVLATGAVAAVVMAVFDRAPVFAHRGQELVRRGRACRATGQTEDHLDGGLDGGAFPDVPLDAQELRGAGEVRGERVGGADPDPAPLAATVVLVERLGVGVRGGVRARLSAAGRRGGNRPAVGFGRGLPGWVGCLRPGQGSRRLFRRRGTVRARADSARRRR